MAVENQASYMFRFGGIGRLYSPTALERFRAAHVCIAGIGGVGSWIVEALARSGVGKLTLIDLDDICESNVNRQIHALDGEIGKPKIEAMAERCRAINPECKVETVLSFITEKNAETLLSSEFDYVIDAIDSSKHKVAIIVAARRLRIPVLTVGGAGGRIDPTQIQIADLSRSFHDPLLQRVRKLLRQQHNFPRNKKRKFNVTCVFSPEEPKYPEICDIDEDEPRSVRLDCESGYGAATHLTGTFGFFAAAAALKYLSKSAAS